MGLPCADTPRNEPLPPNLTVDELILQKMRAVCAQTNTPSILRTLRLANPNFWQRQQWYSIQLTMERRDELGCSSNRPRVLGLVELSVVSSTVVCLAHCY